ncbi:LOW QUALITY PROTEIN: serine/threonine-protein phosphatase 6 regulatory subunit 3-B-like [Manduca sexta]|uniref:LOW QUALITY PROTEIN: serine/threonine-protein phosphatase 6 regulatory subunit 3-B-like n=1 Tax=Manduca sexta TaxID=7130 RepID=UPI00188FFA17|nr:LOW QUALITY PROTEIN: serine/threonine-protein phosphatase 6 regulatory subunit 3-B-like [Manduca sexta]
MDVKLKISSNEVEALLFLTRPEILAELITLITEEPPRNVELAMQYRHANMACEVLTSHLSMLSDRLSLGEVQMHRLCDFLLRDPPLNPLLASYFSKTIEMLLIGTQKQDWYLYHIVCLRVLDFFRSRRDFLPNLLKHISTSAIADIFKYFIRLDQFSEIVLEWLDEHQFLDALIQIICGSYVPEELESSGGSAGRLSHAGDEHNHDDSDAAADADTTQRTTATTTGTTTATTTGTTTATTTGSDTAHADTEGRGRRAASAVEVVGAVRTAVRVRGGGGQRGRVSSPSSCSPPARPTAAPPGRVHGGRARAADALVHACRAVRALLQLPLLPDVPHAPDAPQAEEESADDQVDVELAVAPHLPLLHNALLRDPQRDLDDEESDGDKGKSVESESEGDKEAETGSKKKVVGQARVEVAALLAQLARAARDEVCCTMLTLGTPGVLLDMFFEYPDNNFLHSEVAAFIRNALENPPYRTQYARHLVLECDMLTRLMDAFEENENKRPGAGRAEGSPPPRAAYMGHLVSALRSAAGAAPALPPALPPALQQRWAAFTDHTLRPLLHHHDTPLGGYHPPEIIYKLENMEGIIASNYDFGCDMAATASMDELADELNADYINELNMGGGSEGLESPEFVADGLGLDADKMAVAKNNFLELANQRFDDDMWDEAPEGDDLDEGEEGDAAGGEGPEGGVGTAVAVHHVLAQPSPWESSGGGGGAPCAEGWASFGAEGAEGADAFPPDDDFAAWPPLPRRDDTSVAELECGVRSLRLERSSPPADDPSSVELTNNLLTAMSAMSPDAIANIVNANMTPFPVAEATGAAPAQSPAAVSTTVAAAAPAPAGGEAARR